MNPPPLRAVLSVLRSVFRRGGLASLGTMLRRRRAQKRDERILRASGLVDGDWYRREYPDVAASAADPVQDFLRPPHPQLRMPNPDFVPAEYAAVNYDVKASGIPWALHYAHDGMREGRAVSELENRAEPFPDGAKELRREFPASPVLHRRTAVFASFSADGRIKDSVLFYLRGLREVADNIVFVADNPVFPDEVRKLEGLVRLAVFRHHGCYDFGSYKIGWNEAKALGLLEPDVCDELVVCNDSCYGPVFPFAETFAEMERRNRGAANGAKFDFWGMTAHHLFGRPHVQSYFYVFGKAVLEEPALARFFERMETCRERGQVVYFCETWISTVLRAAGHRFDTLVPPRFSLERRAPPIKFPLTLLSEYRMPLFKAKTLKGESLENLAGAVDIVRKNNPALAALLPPPPPATSFERKSAGLADSAVLLARKRHGESLERTRTRLRNACGAGQPLRLLFLTASAEPFHGGGLLEAVRRDAAFRPVAAVVPDFRLASPAPRFSAMREARAALLAKHGGKDFVRIEPDAVGQWPDLAADADVVCWETAENASDFRYNPHWAVGRDFLPVLFFDRRTAGPYPPEKEFARQNYAYFWKIFFSDRGMFDLYAAHSLLKGANAVLAKTGDLASAALRVLKTDLDVRSRSI